MADIWGHCRTVWTRTACGLISDDTRVAVAVQVVRKDDETRFQYMLTLPPPLETYHGQIMEHLDHSPVRTTLSKPLTFEPVTP